MKLLKLKLENFKGIRDFTLQAAGLTQQAMSDLLGIPKRNIENWEGGAAEAPRLGGAAYHQRAPKDSQRGPSVTALCFF